MGERRAGRKTIRLYGFLFFSFLLFFFSFSSSSGSFRFRVVGGFFLLFFSCLLCVILLYLASSTDPPALFAIGRTRTKHSIDLQKKKIQEEEKKEGFLRFLVTRRLAAGRARLGFFFPVHPFTMPPPLPLPSSNGVDQVTCLHHDDSLPRVMVGAAGRQARGKKPNHGTNHGTASEGQQPTYPGPVRMACVCMYVSDD